jgi:hypothetical protein
MQYPEGEEILAVTSLIRRNHNFLSLSTSVEKKMNCFEPHQRHSQA